MQPPYFPQVLLVAALSTFTTSSSASFVDLEVAPSALTRAFGIRSAEPEAEAWKAGFEDSKYNFLGPLKIPNFLGPANKGFPDSHHNALFPKEATKHSSKIYKELNLHNILTRRSGEPEPEAEPIVKSLFKFNKVYSPGQGLQDTTRSGLFNLKEKRSSESEPKALSKSTNSLLAKSLSLWISLWVKQ